MTKTSGPWSLDAIASIDLPDDVRRCWESMRGDLDQRGFVLLGMLALDESLPMQGRYNDLAYETVKAFERLLEAVGKHDAETADAP